MHFRQCPDNTQPIHSFIICSYKLALLHSSIQYVALIRVTVDLFLTGYMKQSYKEYVITICPLPKAELSHGQQCLSNAISVQYKRKGGLEYKVVVSFIEPASWNNSFPLNTRYVSSQRAVHTDKLKVKCMKCSLRVEQRQPSQKQSLIRQLNCILQVFSGYD